MSEHTFRSSGRRGEILKSMLIGALFALALFVLMATAQMMGDVDLPDHDLTESLVAYAPPVVEELEELEPLIEKEEEPPPELEQEAPQLSLEQLDIALNPGTGGSLMGDFAMPTLAVSSSSLGTAEFVDFSDLDRLPKPIGVSGFDFPRRLRKQKVNGRIVLMVKLGDDGSVLEVVVASSDLPQFDEFVRSEVERWRFTPPTQQGRPVRAQARLPIPIRIS